MTHALRRWTVLGTLIWAQIAIAAPTPPLAQLSLPSGQLTIEADGALRFVGTGAAIELAKLDSHSARLRAIEVGGVHLIEATTREGRRGHMVLLAIDKPTPELIIDEPFGPNTDGELTRDVEFGREIRRWQTTSGVTRCDGAQPLFRETYDLGRRAWIRRPLNVPVAPPLIPVGKLALPSPRRALRFSSASSDGQSESADRLGAPRELDDDDDRTAWSPGVPAQGAFVTAQASRAIALTAIRIVPPPAPAKLPAALVLIGGNPARPLHRLVLTGTGDRWFSLPSVPRATCVSFVVDDPTGTDLAIAAIDLFAADDEPAGLAHLAHEVAIEGPDAEAAAHELEASGPAGADAVFGALADSRGAGRSRLLRTMRTHRERITPEQGRALGHLLEIASGQERALIVEILAGKPKEALAEAAQLLSDPSQASEAQRDAIELLGRISASEPAAIAMLFDALHGDERALARRALQRAAHDFPAVGLEAARRLPSEKHPDDLVAVIGAARPSATDRATMMSALTALGPIETQPFSLAVRILSAIRGLGGPVREIAARTIAASSDPTLRLVAIASLPADKDPSTFMILSSAANDADASVRERAMQELGTAASAPLLRARADDRWPQLRRLAYAGMAAACDADTAALLDARVFGKHADADAQARSVALASLARCPGTELLRVASAVSAHQPSLVRERAAQLLAELGGPSALSVLSRALDHVYARGGAELPDTAVALLRAIGRVGAQRGATPFDDATLTLLRDSAGDPFFPAIRIAALDALATGCPDGARIVFDRTDKDPEPAVQRASAIGRGRCTR